MVEGPSNRKKLSLRRWVFIIIGYISVLILSGLIILFGGVYFGPFIGLLLILILLPLLLYVGWGWFIKR